MKRLSSIVVLCVVLVLSGGLRAEQGGGSRESEHARNDSAVRRASEAVASLSLRADRVHVWLREARNRRQTARSRCLDPLLSQAHAVERQGAIELALLERAQPNELGAHMQRIGNIVARSRQILAQANVCGKVVSRRVRAPTQYRVRLLATR